MTFLAYDPLRLTALEVRTRVALEQLHRLRSDDPEATDTMRTIRTVQLHLGDGLLPLVRRILDQDPLREPIPERDDLPAVQNALARYMAVEHGWAVMVDPRPDDPQQVTFEEAFSLARRLREIPPAELVNDPERLGWLTAELDRIGRDPHLAATFDAEFGEWAPWMTALAQPRARRMAGIDTRLQVSVDQLDATIDAFARVAHHAVTGGRGPSAALAAMDDMPRYAAALFLRDLGLPPDLLGDAAARLVTRQRDDLDELPGPNTNDTVLQQLLAEPMALPHFLLRTAPHLVQVAHDLADPSLLEAALIRGTDPELIDARAAGRIVVPALQWYLDDPEHATGTFAAELVVPWTAQFAVANDDWDIDVAERVGLIERALQTPDSLAAFISQRDRLVANARRHFSTGSARPVNEYTSYLALIGGLIVNARVRIVEMRKAVWGIVTDLGSLAVSLVPGVAVGAALTLGVMYVAHLGEPDPKAVFKEQLRGSDLVITMAAVNLADMLQQKWVAEGKTTYATPDPPELRADETELPSIYFIRDFIDWVEGLPGGDLGEMAREAEAVIYSVLNGTVIGEHALAYYL
jgi:hypothetical protein